MDKENAYICHYFFHYSISMQYKTTILKSVDDLCLAVIDWATRSNLCYPMRNDPEMTNYCCVNKGDACRYRQIFLKLVPRILENVAEMFVK